MKLRPGLAVIARCEVGLQLVRGTEGVEVVLNQGQEKHPCRPAVDLLFRSAGELYGASALVVMLTGSATGRAPGRAQPERVTGLLLLQENAASLSSGTPRATGIPPFDDGILPLQRIVPKILKLL